MRDILLYIVIPCYNEEDVLPVTKDLFLDKINYLTINEQVRDFA